MKRITLAVAVALIALLPAEASALTVQVGSVTTERPCLIARSYIVLVPRQPHEPPVAAALPPEPTGSCKDHAPLRLHRARRMTITAEVERMTAAWFEGASAPPSPLPVRSAGPATWLLTLPPTSGRLVLSAWHLPTRVFAGVTQLRLDLKLSIRRTVKAQPPGPVSDEAGPPVQTKAPAPEPAITFDGSG